MQSSDSFLSPLRMDWALALQESWSCLFQVDLTGETHGSHCLSLLACPSCVPPAFPPSWLWRDGVAKPTVPADLSLFLVR